MAGIGSASGFVRAVSSKLHGRKAPKRRRPRHCGPLFEVLEPRLLLSASATFATSALADYGPKPPGLMMPLTAGAGGTQSSAGSLSLSNQTAASGVGQSSLTNAGVTQSPAYTLSTLATFDRTDGAQPQAGLTLVGGELYGTTYLGNPYGGGTVFSVPIAGGTPTVVASFTGADGVLPYAGLTLSGGTLYGTAMGGGNLSLNNGFGGGTVFSLPITGGTPTVLASFNGTDGEYPNGRLTLSGGTLYGTTRFGGANGDGTVFSLPITGGTPTVLASFNGTDGISPYGGLTLSGGTLYGTTYEGGSYGCGTVFSVPITGGTPTVLATFDGTDGAAPTAGLTLSGGTLYGTTQQGGANGYSNGGTGDGTVFSVPITGGTPSTLASFNGTDGATSEAGLTLSGGALYGTTYFGGANFDGTVFSVPIAGGTPTVVASFNGTDGQFPWAGLTLSGGALYGTTSGGGAGGYGTVFELTPAGPTITGVTPTAIASGSGGPNWSFNIQGTDLGSLTPYSGQDAVDLNLVDTTQGFSMGYTGDAVTANVSAWSDSSVTISGLAGAYGSGSYIIKPGDQMSLTVANPETGAASSQYTFTMPALAPSTSTPAISNVSIAPLSGSTNNWTMTISGSNFGTQNPFSTTSPDLLIVDNTNNMPAGNTGDTVTANVTSWTNSQIVIQGFGGQYGQPGLTINSGDKLTVAITNPQTGEQGSLAVTVPAVVAPVINNVSFQQSNGDWTMTVVGSDLGTHVPFVGGTSAYLAVADTTDGQNIGHAGDPAAVTVTSWTDTTIVVTGFVADNSSLGAAVINAGDAITVTVWNPQTDAKSAAYSASVPQVPVSPPVADTMVSVSTSVDSNGNWNVAFSAGAFSTNFVIDTAGLNDALNAVQIGEDVEGFLGYVPGFHLQANIEKNPVLAFSLNGDMYFNPATGHLDTISLTNSLSAKGLGATLEGYFGEPYLNIGVGIDASVTAGLNDTISLGNGALVWSGGGYVAGTLGVFASAAVPAYYGTVGLNGSLRTDLALSSSGYLSAALTASGTANVEVDSIFSGKVWGASYNLGSYPLGKWGWNIEPQIQAILNDATGAFDAYLGIPQTSSTLAAAPLPTASRVGSTSSISSSELTLSLASNTVSHTVATAPTLNARQSGIVQTINTTHSSTADSTTSTVTRHPSPGFELASTNGSATLYFAGFASAPSVQAPGVGFGELGGGLLPNILESPLTVGSLWVA